MAEANRVYSDEELLAEIFGFLPNKLIDEFYDNMNSVFGNMIEGIFERLKTLAPDKQNDLNHALDDFAQHCESGLDMAFNIFQQYIYDNIWKIPKGLDIKPEHYKGLELNLSDESDALIQEEIEKKKKQLLAQKAYQRILLNDISKKEKELKGLNQYEQFIQNITSLPEDQKYESSLELLQSVKDKIDLLKQTTVQSIMTSKEVAKNITDSDTRSSYLRESLKRQLDIFTMPPSKRTRQDD